MYMDSKHSKDARAIESVYTERQILLQQVTRALMKHPAVNCTILEETARSG